MMLRNGAKQLLGLFLFASLQFTFIAHAKSKLQVAQKQVIQEHVSDLYGDSFVDLGTINKNIRLDIRYATKDNFTGRVLYPEARCFLRKSVADKLDRIQKKLEKRGLGLKVFDGYRPHSVQKIMRTYCPIDGLVGDPKKGSNHNRGAAVDLTLVYVQTGEELEMPSEFDDLSERAHRKYRGCSKAALKNSKLLEDYMKKEGFDPLPTEWWHFNDKNALHFPILDLSFKALDALIKEQKNEKPSLISQRPMIVNVPVVDVLVDYTKACHSFDFDADAVPILSKHNGNQLTQLLLGEQVQMVGLENGWAAIRANEQQVFNKVIGTWEGCPGWVRFDQLTRLPEHYKKKSQLFVRKSWTPIYADQGLDEVLFEVCLGTRLMGIKEFPNEWQVLLPDGRKGFIAKTDIHIQKLRRIEALFADKKEEARFRKTIAKMSLSFLRYPYYIWGGRSLHHPDIPCQYTGSDCSGAVGLLFAAFGIAIPRGSSGQYLKSRQLQHLTSHGIGDLIFLGKSDTQIDHVMMYLGGDKIFELTGRTKPGACISSGIKYFGKPILQVKAGDSTNDGRRGYFGSYIRCLRV